MKRLFTPLILVLFLCSIVFASEVTKDVVGSGNWTAALSSEKGARINVSISDANTTTDLTITLQRKFDSDSSWGRDVDTWDVTGSTADVESITTEEPENGVSYRLGCEDWTSGNCTVRLGGGRK